MQPSSPLAPRASVVVPVYNGAATLAACLASLSQQSVHPRDYEAIIVDDGSTDGSAEIAARSGGTLMRQRHLGAASARNRGAQQARGEILLFTDADCEPAPDWIERMLAPFENPGLVGVKGAYRTRQRSIVARFAQAEFEEKYDRMQRAPLIDFVDTYSAGYRRSSFLALGGFDPGIRFVEDQDLSYRMARAGHKMLFEPSAIVYHKHPGSILSYCWRKIQFGRWKVKVLIRHPSKLARDSYTPSTQKAQIALLPVLVATAWGAAVDAIAWGFVLVPATLGLFCAMPLVLRAARQGWWIGVLGPLLVLLRALALAVGLIVGVVEQVGLALSTVFRGKSLRESSR